MIANAEKVLIKTPQGINATRSGVGLSQRAYAMLKLFDSAMPIGGFRKICLGNKITEDDFQATLDELLKFEHLRMTDPAATASEANARAVESQMLLTLDFTVNDVTPAAKSFAMGKPATREVAVQAAGSPAMPQMPAAPVHSPATQAAQPDSARVGRSAAMRKESEERQKLIATLQPRIEEELRARLRPKLEQELRPKLIAALRPGIEAELRAVLTRELTPRVELELKARFAKSMAARKSAEDQASAPVTPERAAPPVDEPVQRLMASLSVPLFTVDKTGVCTYVSPGWAQFSGYDNGELIGQHLADFFADRERRAVTTLLTGVANASTMRFEQQGELRHKDGRGLWVELTVAPLTSATGETVGVCGSLRDASETRRVLDRAEADGVRLLLLVEQIETGVILEDSEGNIQQANPALCVLLSLEVAPYSLEGMAVAELFELASKGFIGPEGFVRRMKELRETGKDARGVSLVMADGRVLEQDYLQVTAGDAVVGHVWLFREMRRTTGGGRA